MEQQRGSRLTGIIRDKSVADRVIRALIHRGIPGDNITVLVSGVNEITFGANEGGVKVVRYPEASETGATAPTYRTGDKRNLADWGVRDSDLNRWEERLRSGDVIFSVACETGKCDMARSVFTDAGAREVEMTGGEKTTMGMGTMTPEARPTVTPASGMSQSPGMTSEQTGPGATGPEMAQPQRGQEAVGHPLSPEEDLNRNIDKMGKMAEQGPVVTDRLYTAVDSVPDQVPYKPVAEAQAAAPSMRSQGEQAKGQDQDQGEEYFVFIVTEIEEFGDQG